MTTNEHIAAIKEHLKAIEAENNQLYLIIPLKEPTFNQWSLGLGLPAIAYGSLDNMIKEQWEALRDLVAQGRIFRIKGGFFEVKTTEEVDSSEIITINEE